MSLNISSWDDFSDQPVRAPQRRLHERKFENVKSWTLLVDALPVDQGGFRPSTIFDTLNFAGMLRSGTIAPGSRFEHMGQTFTVIEGGEIVDQDGAIWRTRSNLSQMYKVTKARKA